MKINDLISVIIPTYKRKPEMIIRSIESVLNQTYTDLELIIVDDSPSDYKFRDDVKKCIDGLEDNRIRYIQHQTNKGANFARNTGIKVAKGKYCAFLDDDDAWERTKLEKQILKFVKDKVALVYCRAITINEVDKTSSPIINEMKSGSQYNNLLKQNFIGSNSFVLIRTDALRTVGMYDQSLLSNQDYDLFLKITKLFEIDFVDEVLVYYYIHNGERITTNQYKQLQGRIALFNKYQHDISKSRELSLIWRIKNIPLYFLAGERFKAVIEFSKLILTSPYFTISYLMKTLEYRKSDRKNKKTFQ